MPKGGQHELKQTVLSSFWGVIKVHNPVNRGPVSFFPLKSGRVFPFPFPFLFLFPSPFDIPPVQPKGALYPAQRTLSVQPKGDRPPLRCFSIPHSLSHSPFPLSFPIPHSSFPIPIPIPIAIPIPYSQSHCRDAPELDQTGFYKDLSDRNGSFGPDRIFVPNRTGSE